MYRARPFTGFLQPEVCISTHWRGKGLARALPAVPYAEAEMQTGARRTASRLQPSRPVTASVTDLLLQFSSQPSQQRCPQ